MIYTAVSQGFLEAFSTMENSATLRSQVTQTLLKTCRSVKVKSLFLFRAEKVDHPWFAKLDINNVDLGKGKHMIVQDGALDKTYGITVPREWVG